VSGPPAFSASPESIVDTVVLRYFARVNETELLIRLLGELMSTPRIVDDDHEEPALPDDARSEITRSIAYQRRARTDPARDREARDEAHATPIVWKPSPRSTRPVASSFSIKSRRS